MKTTFSNPERGAVLIVAMLLAAIIGVSLVSFIKLSNNSLKQAHRTFYSNSAMNLAEVGLEEAIARFNQLDNVATPADAWPSPWTLDATAYNSTTSPWTPKATTTLSGFTVGPNTTGSIKIWVQFYAGDAGRTPKIVAKSTIQQPDGSPPISKYIEVELRKRGLFNNGLVARQDITWVGQPMADSWDSKYPYTSATTDTDGDGIMDLYDLDADGNGTNELPTPYAVGIRSANVVVGSIGGSIDLAGGDVWGYAKTGEFGNIRGGSVHPLGTTTDDPSRRTNDFNATFPTPTVPTPSYENTIPGTITASTEFPRPGDTAVNVGGVQTYFYRFDAGEAITLSGSDHIQITANRNVVFLMTSHAGASAIRITGTTTGGMDIGLGGSLNIYTDGNIAIGGNGSNMANANASSSSCIIYGLGTASGTQTIDVSGNGQLNACVYAPNAAVTLNGGGTNGLMNGAVIAKSISMNGHTEFHYDDALSRLTVGNPYGIQKWRELQSASERATYATPLNF